jgi:hypothetical protein
VFRSEGPIVWADEHAAFRINGIRVTIEASDEDAILAAARAGGDAGLAPRIVLKAHDKATGTSGGPFALHVPSMISRAWPSPPDDETTGAAGTVSLEPDRRSALCVPASQSSSPCSFLLSCLRSDWPITRCGRELLRR